MTHASNTVTVLWCLSGGVQHHCKASNDHQQALQLVQHFTDTPLAQHSSVSADLTC